MRSVAALWLAGSLAAASPTQDLLARAEQLIERKNYPAAESLLREILRSDPSHARAHGNLALVLLRQQRVREAVEEGRLAEAFAPGSAEAAYIAGLTLRAAGRNIDAARAFEKVAAAKPDEAGPLGALADAYAAMGDERAAPIYERLLVLEPRRKSHRLAFAEHLWSTGKDAQGNAIAAAALREDPDFAQLHARYGAALFAQQRFVDASDELTRARDLGIADAETAGLLANAHWQAGRIEAARAAFESAVQAHPDSASLRLDLGRLLLAQGEAAAAQQHLEVAAHQFPADALTRYQLGRALEGAGRLAEAEQAYRQAVGLSPRLASPRYALGRLLVRQGRKEEAEKELAVYRDLYARAARIQFETESRRAEIQLAESELASGRPDAALARLESLPEGADVLTGRARALSRLDRHPEAVRALERARELRPDEVRIQSLLAAERDLASVKP